MRTNTAYNLYTFEAARPEVEVKVVKTRARKTRAKLSFKAAAVVYLTVIIALMGFTVYNHCLVTETQTEIDRVNSRIAQLQTEYRQLNVRLENMVSLHEAEAYAVNELGMVKLDSSQVIYVKLLTENTFAPGEESPNAVDAFMAVIGSVADYFGR